MPPVWLVCSLLFVVLTSAQEGGAAAPSGFNFDDFTSAFGVSFGAILATEIGDRTFFIAAIMAMRYGRFVIWLGAVAALAVMTILSTLVGHVAPLLIPRTYTQYAAAGLFLFFGVKMIRDGMSVEHAGASEELEEVEAELTKKQVRHTTPHLGCRRTRRFLTRPPLSHELHMHTPLLAGRCA